MRKHCSTPRKSPQSHSKSLTTALFQEKVNEALSKLYNSVSTQMRRDQYAKRWLTFLDESAQNVRVRSRSGLERFATCWEVSQGALRTAHPTQHLIVMAFLTSPDYPLAAGLLLDLGDIAQELGLRSKDVAGYVRRSLQDFLPDNRPEPVRKGEFCEKVIGELKQLREQKSEFHNFSDLEGKFSEMKVVQIMKAGPFDEDLRDLLAHPNQWEHVVAYGTGILKRHFGERTERGIKEKSDHTILKWRKLYKQSIKGR